MQNVKIATLYEIIMDVTTLLAIVLFFVVLGGGWYGHGRWYGRRGL
jgi:hypothetical protein